MSTYIRDQPEVARRQSQVWRPTTPQGGEGVRRGALGCALGRWLESWRALSVALVSLQVGGPRRLYRRRCDCYRRSRNGGCRYSSARSARAEDLRKARDTLRYSSLIGVVECLTRVSRCALFKGRGEDAVRDVFS